MYVTVFLTAHNLSCHYLWCNEMSNHIETVRTNVLYVSAFLYSRGFPENMAKQTGGFITPGTNTHKDIVQMSHGLNVSLYFLSKYVPNGMKLHI